MIVIEGCDGTGKTTLLKYLADELNLKVGLRGTEDRDLLYSVTRQDTYNALAAGIHGHHPIRLWDRLGPFSDPIYAPVTGRSPAFSDAELYWIRGVIEAARFPVIRCMAPFEVVQANCAKDYQMEGVNENLRKIYNAYRLGKWFPRHTITHDYTKDNRETVLSTLQNYIIKRGLREW